MGRGEQFSYEAKNALFDWLEQWEDETGEPVELDVIALCCEYSEMDDLDDYNSQYDEVESIEDIEELTMVIRIPKSDGFIIQQY